MLTKTRWSGSEIWLVQLCEGILVEWAPASRRRDQDRHGETRMNADGQRDRHTAIGTACIDRDAVIHDRLVMVISRAIPESKWAMGDTRMSIVPLTCVSNPLTHTQTVNI